MSKDDRTRIIAFTLRGEGKSQRAIAKQLGISKSTIGRWFKDADDAVDKVKTPVNPIIKEADALVRAEGKDVKISDRYSDYIDTLKTVKDRQGKWAGAVTETGVRSLKLANKFLAILEKKEKLDKLDMELMRLVPGLMSCSTAAIKSAAEAEDRAYSLETLVDTLNELPQQVKAANSKTDPKPVVANS